MSIQRRHGQPAIIYKTKVTKDNRGNSMSTSDMTAPVAVRAVFTPQRSARAEVPGQAQINIVRMIVAAHIQGVDLWSRVEWDGRQWDIVSPPAYHHGTRHTRHWALDLRERP